MLKKVNFSQKFGLNISGHHDIDFVDINIEGDSLLFIDPCLIECCNDDLSKTCSATISDYFGKLYTVLKDDNVPEIYRHLSHLGERNEARLGYGNGRNGKAKTAEGMIKTLSGLRRLITDGIPLEKAIDIPILMPRFERDCMSDMLLNVLYKPLSEYTIQQCQLWGIPTVYSTATKYYWDFEEHCWKIYHGKSLVIGGETILLVPKRYVCKGLYYSTSHFFLSKIAPMLQNRDVVIIDGKQQKPNKQEVKKAESKEHGSLLDATVTYAKIYPKLLSEYHADIPIKYYQRCLSDDVLDKLLYGTMTESA
ncbi:MAG: hypothetical protein J6V80_05435 [Clostridia bacterium]|nr:hypothetical protein [Clostridia bacterium]